VQGAGGRGNVAAMIPRRVASLIVALAALVSLSAQVRAQSAPAAAPAPATSPEPPLSPPEMLARAKSWAYQLQKPSPGQIAASPFDVIVIDYSRNGTDAKRFKPVDVKWMKRRPDGGERIVLAYMSLGEAEDYRFYWDESWIETAAPEPTAGPAAQGDGAPAPAAAPAPPPAPAAGAGPTPGVAPAEPAASSLPPKSTPARRGEAVASVAVQPAKPDRWLSPLAPPWLGDENERWSGNFEVKYWEKSWQDIIFGTSASYLERIIAAGFDGVYLDRIDAFYLFQDERATAPDEMVDFVVRLAAHARALKPGFLIVPQNGEELLLKPAYVKAINGIAKEDLFFGGGGNGVRNDRAATQNSLGWLSHATAAKLPVFVVEYLAKPEHIAEARKQIEARGFVPYVGVRELDTLVLPGQSTAEAAAARAPVRRKSAEVPAASAASASPAKKKP